MRARGRTILVVLVGALLVLSGCAGAPEEPTSPFPPRPKNLDLSNVDLCATLTPEQKRERGIDEENESVGSTVANEQTSTCNWTDGEHGDYYAIQIFQGAASDALYKEGARISEIAGFGAVRGQDENPAKVPGTPPFCQISIDASDTQALRVQHGGGAGDASSPADHEAACRVATRLAEDILTNLSR